MLTSLKFESVMDSLTYSLDGCSIKSLPSITVERGISVFGFMTLKSQPGFSVCMKRIFSSFSSVTSHPSSFDFFYVINRSLPTILRLKQFHSVLVRDNYLTGYTLLFEGLNFLRF